MAGRGRPKGSTNKPKGAPKADKPKAAPAGKSGTGFTGGAQSTLTDRENAALFLMNVGKYEKALAAKKAADADLKNSCKAIRSDLGDGAIDEIKQAIEMRSDEGRLKIEAQIARIRRVAEWCQIPLGAQGDLFGKDRRPKTEIAFVEGYEAGVKGEWCKVPSEFGDESTPTGVRWVDGWKAGQASITSIKEKRGPEIFRPAAPEDATGEAGDAGEGEEGDGDEGPEEEASAVIHPAQGAGEADRPAAH